MVPSHSEETNQRVKTEVSSEVNTEDEEELV